MIFNVTPMGRGSLGESVVWIGRRDERFACGSCMRNIFGLKCEVGILTYFHVGLFHSYSYS